jgi:hypothetical protein
VGALHQQRQGHEQPARDDRVDRIDPDMKVGGSGGNCHYTEGKPDRCEDEHLD